MQAQNTAIHLKQRPTNPWRPETPSIYTSQLEVCQYQERRVRSVRLAAGILEGDELNDWMETVVHSWESVRVNSGLCLASRLRGECGLCAEACPTGALRFIDGDLRYDTTDCRACGVCAVTCPTGALDAFAPLEGAPIRLTMALACTLVARPTESVCRCLAGVPPSVWLSALAVSGPLALIHGDCRGCSQAAEQMVRALPRRLELLGHLVGRPVEVRLEQRASAPASPDEPKRKQGYSRRQFFRLLGWGGQRAGTAAAGAGPVGRTVMSWVEGGPGAKGAGPERERFVRTLRLIQVPAGKNKVGLERLPLGTSESDPAALAGTGSLARLHLDVTRCTGCRTCALFCPTGALGLHESESCWRLTFSAARCTACGVCISLCDPGALRLEWATLADLAGTPAILIETPLTNCDDCGIAVPEPATERVEGRVYCRSCARRRQGGALAL